MTNVNILLPPPRNTGDANTDQLQSSRWMGDLYEYFVKVLNVPGGIVDLKTAEQNVATLQTQMDETITALNETILTLTATNALLDSTVTTLNSTITTLNDVSDLLDTTVATLNTTNTTLASTVTSLNTLTTTYNATESILTAIGLMGSSGIGSGVVLQLRVVNNAGNNIVNLSLGIPDSGGVGFRTLNVPN